MAETKNDPLSLHYGSAQPGEGVILTPGQEAARGSQAAPQTVTMEVLSDRSYDGVTRHVGDTIDVPPDLVETFTLSGFAVRADRAALAERARADDQARKDALAKRRGGKATVVQPLGTRDAHAAESKKQE